MVYKDEDKKEYLFNLIDTPGHVDFAYEVSRSLAACEGALLLIDAAQGVEAQTVANAHLATSQGLEIIPVINKIDLPSADPDRVLQQLEDILTIPREEAIFASGKTGVGTLEILRAVIERVPEPRWVECEQTRILIFDSVYDPYKGVICYVRIFSGGIKPGDTVTLMSDGTKTLIKEVGRFSPKMKPEPELFAGNVGYIVTNIKSVSEIRIGDTITSVINPSTEMLPGFKQINPMVFSGVYPIDTSDYPKLVTSMGKLRLNDSALSFQTENSNALGFGFRCGFLGLLHMEIVQERLRREYDLDIISTYPSVIYRVTTMDGEIREIDNPLHFPDPSEIGIIEEPIIKARIHTPNECIGDLLALVAEKRGYCDHTENLDTTRIMIVCVLPLNEILIDFNDRLKSITRGYGSMEYEMDGHAEAKLVRMDILVNGEIIDAFSLIVHKEKAENRGRILCEKLKEILPRQMFKIAVQAAIGGKIVARETIGAYRKDVTAKCYGGDISRKRKLLEKQKAGKKRMKQVGSVSIPQEAFVNILKNTNG